MNNILVKNPFSLEHLRYSPHKASDKDDGFLVTGMKFGIVHSENITYEPTSSLHKLTRFPTMSLPEKSAKEIKENTEKLIIRPTGIAGFGVFARPRKVIEEGALICMYAGVVANQPRTQRMDDSYCMNIRLTDNSPEKFSDCYVSSEREGSIARFFQCFPVLPPVFGTRLGGVNKLCELKSDKSLSSVEQPYCMDTVTMSQVAYANVRLVELELKEGQHKVGVRCLQATRRILENEPLGYSYGDFIDYWGVQYYKRLFFDKKGDVIDIKKYKTLMVSIVGIGKQSFVEITTVNDAYNNIVRDKGELTGKLSEYHTINIYTAVLTGHLLNMTQEEQTLDVNDPFLNMTIDKLKTLPNEKILAQIQTSTYRYATLDPDEKEKPIFSLTQVLFYHAQGYRELARRHLKDKNQDALKCYLFEAAQCYLKLGMSEQFREYYNYYQNPDVFITIENNGWRCTIL